MANEKKTERIVYSHFEQSNDIIHIEEQSSDISKVDKLLKSASKKGIGKGRPEFIITYKKNNDLLIVIECKADITKHESINRDKYADFAVDGVLLYASYLSKDFDVLAIAVSGETQQQLKVSHFLHLKNERKATEIFGDKLLPAQDYLDGYLKSPEKFRQDYNTLLAFTKTLNEKLHSYKVLESQRSLLISCILIALEDDAFRKSYSLKNTPKSLADFLTKTVAEKLEEANISGKKLENLIIQFSFIKTDTSLSSKDRVLKDLIDEIDANINSFIKTHEYFDVLGQLYIEFLRYANSDKGLGIVLTPPHITELFADLAQVNKNSIVYDNCTGTGGFLIAAMKKMIEDAKGDKAKIAAIKSHQLIGVEYQAHIFALAVSNMYIHQDGKTNIINGSCFEEEIIKEVKNKKPTVGFLNPPYTNEKDEIKFILNNLECLVDGGTCIAIVPMRCALATSGKEMEYKNELLTKHTLEAVLSMPNDLFADSEANTFTCAMIFTAHKKHPKNHKTFFGYFKDDGFEKRKINGRTNLFGKWESIKSYWIDTYKNRDEVMGFSIKKNVVATDEWTVETYLETDYTKLNDTLFINEIRKFIAYQVLYLEKAITSKDFRNNTAVANLATHSWVYFNIKDIFKLEKCKCANATSLLENGNDIFYIGAKKSDNGVMQKVELVESLVSEGNCIVFIGDGQGSVGYSTYQPIDFIGSTTLTCGYNNQLNIYNALFIVTVLDLERYKYSFGRKYGKAQLMKAKIKLPAKSGQPDFEFMENYIKSLPYANSL
jgi:type I restriction-modification system DNA methylase subunit